MTIEKEAANLIKENYKSKDSVYNGRYTKTALFLLPMLELSLRHNLVNRYLVNAYLDDKGLEHDYKRPIFLLFKVKSFMEKDWMDFSNYLRESTMLVYDYDLGVQDGHNLVMKVFETPTKWKEDYYHFKAGRYSKFSSAYKVLFPKETLDEKKQKTESLMWGVINKSPYRKDFIANHFCVKDNDGKIKNQDDLKQAKEFVDTLEEIWDICNSSEEYYRWNLEKKV